MKRIGVWTSSMVYMKRKLYDSKPCKKLGKFRTSSPQFSPLTKFDNDQTSESCPT